MAKNNTKQTFAAKPPAALKQTMAKPISGYTDPVALRTLMENARRLGRDDIWREAFRRLCTLEGADQTDPLHRDFYQTLAAYEQLLTQKNGRATRASRTRLKLKSKGVVQCLEDWALSKTPTEGYELLVANGLVEMTGETLVLKYPEQFSEGAVAAAKARLAAPADQAA
ncbi:MAG: hypothetical protein A3D94_14280 [Alphaproteobacteria bacterium RIFCSPHIGHO2_12_FULL_66_14]|nr:MAG: hypothetical protein A3D94_14280 [Alphaproteobacteria bacterium RIFCSPHIGHO2_12_FULL_66_14]